MRLTKLTTPTTLAISLADVKDHLRIERDESGYDDDLTELIYTAMEFVEAETHLTLINTQFTAVWDDFPGDKMKIPGFPIVTVDSIAYTDTDGNSATWASSKYRTSLVQTPCTVQPAIGEDYPDVQVDAIDAVALTFTAGYGTAATDQTRTVRHLLKLIISHWFKERESVGTVPTHRVRMAFDSLKHHARVNEWEGFLVQ